MTVPCGSHPCSCVSTSGSPWPPLLLSLRNAGGPRLHPISSCNQPMKDHVSTEHYVHAGCACQVCFLQFMCNQSNELYSAGPDPTCFAPTPRSTSDLRLPNMQKSLTRYGWLASAASCLVYLPTR